MKYRVYVALAACLWGMWSIAFRAAERAQPGLSAAVETLVVFSVSMLLTAPLAWRTRRPGPRPRSAWIQVMALGAADAINALCFFTALQRTTVAIAVLTHYLAPLFVACAAPLVLGERFRARTAVALGIALLGLTLLLQPWTATSFDDVDGALLGALSAVFFASTVIFAKRAGPHFSTMELATYPKLASLPVLALAALVAGGGTITLELDALAILAAGALVFGAVPLVMFYVGLARTPASQAGVLTLCEPLVAVLVGALIWREAMGALALCGGALVLVGAGVIATTRGTAKDSGSHVVE